MKTNKDAFEGMDREFKGALNKELLRNVGEVGVGER